MHSFTATSGANIVCGGAIGYSAYAQYVHWDVIYSASEYSSNLHKVKYSGYNCVNGFT